MEGGKKKIKTRQRSRIPAAFTSGYAFFVFISSGKTSERKDAAPVTTDCC
jgi:hypothetical protein